MSKNEQVIDLLKKAIKELEVKIVAIENTIKYLEEDNKVKVEKESVGTSNVPKELLKERIRASKLKMTLIAEAAGISLHTIYGITKTSSTQIISNSMIERIDTAINLLKVTK